MESAAISTPTSKVTTSAVQFWFSPLIGQKKSASSVPKTKKKRLSTSSHDFVCLWSTTTTKPPSCLKIVDLIRAGLGRKQITLFDEDGSHKLHREILHTFPHLSEGGGYELLRVAETGQRNLSVIPSPSDGRKLLGVLTQSSEPNILYLLHAHTVCTVPFLLDVASWLA